MKDNIIFNPLDICKILEGNSSFSIIKIQIRKKLKNELIKELISKTESIPNTSKNYFIELKDKPTIIQTQSKITKIIKTHRKMRTSFTMCIENSNYIFQKTKLQNSNNSDLIFSSLEFQKLAPRFLKSILIQSSELIYRISSNPKDIYEIGHNNFQVNCIIRFFSNIKNPQFETLKTLSCSFYSIPLLQYFSVLFSELSYEKYEHIEQNIDSEKVESDRITEGQEILEDTLKCNDEEELLSFLKAGVPNDFKNQFYNQYYEVLLKTKLKAKQSEEASVDDKEHSELFQLLEENLVLAEELVAKNASKFWNTNEFFPFENSFKKTTSYYFKIYKKLNLKKGKMYLGFLPFESIEFFLVIASSVSITSKNCNTFFKIIFEQIYVPIFDFQSDNEQNLIALCQCFEELFLLEMNGLFFHLKSIGFCPLGIAAKWFASLFVGVFRSQQILYLIDRILGFESLFLLPILALGIFKLFHGNLIKISSADEVEKLLWLWDFSIIKLINLILFE